MLYLAMTAGELEQCQPLCDNIAWMSCRFSAHNRGLTNRPASLPPSCVIMVDDQVPISDHDPRTVESQLLELVDAFDPAGILLDFQRPGGQEMVRHLVNSLPCPTAVSQLYAEGLTCPVFLSPGPLCRPLAHIWPGREKWLDVPIGSQTVTVGQDGAQVSDWMPLEKMEGFYHQRLAVRYKIRCLEDQVEFTLSRSPQELEAFMQLGSNVGITRFFCLFREFMNGAAV